MASKYYVVWKGRQTGVFNDWSSCKAQVEKFAGAKYKSFKTMAEAEAAFSGKPCALPLPSNKTKATYTRKRYTAKGVKTYTAEEISGINAITKIFTDGGCEPNPGEAGSGIAIYRNEIISELWYGLYNPKGTNNTAELNALKHALIIAKSEIESGNTVAIFCDSKYSIQCITKWAANWEKKGWKKQGGDIKNLELIKEIFAQYQQLKSQLQILHVNGHVGVEGNELADRMSIKAIDTKEKAFTKFADELDIDAILALRTGQPAKMDLRVNRRFGL